jgi:hypothetical protein
LWSSIIICPDGAAKWVRENFPSVRVVHDTNDTDWNSSKARNLGARASQSAWLCFIDADIKIIGDFASLLDKLAPDHFYRAAMREKNRELSGTVICSREAYDRVKGYDEVFKGWGGEDTDFCERLKLQGYFESSFECNLEAIPNDDSERFRFEPQPSQTRKIKIIKSHLYTAVKKQIICFRDAKGDLPLRMRAKLYAESRRFC